MRKIVYATQQRQIPRSFHVYVAPSYAGYRNKKKENGKLTMFSNGGKTVLPSEQFTVSRRAENCRPRQ